MGVSGHTQDYRDSEVGALRKALRQANASLISKDRELEIFRKSVGQNQQASAELHHRLRNSFQLLICTLRLQEKSVANPEGASAIASARARVTAIGQVHHYLSADGRSGSVSSRGYIGGLCREIGDSLDLACAVSIEDFDLEIAVAAALGAILNELIINAAKHAFSPVDSRREVEVKFSRDADEALLLTISDNGPGMPEGFQLERSTSLGLRIVYSTAAQLGGSVSVGCDHGAKFCIRVPKPTLSPILSKDPTLQLGSSGPDVLFGPARLRQAIGISDGAAT